MWIYGRALTQTLNTEIYRHDPQLLSWNMLTDEQTNKYNIPIGPIKLNLREERIELKLFHL
jgi:hypothetical protein